jgi:hypothetical protein
MKYLSSNSFIVVPNQDTYKVSWLLDTHTIIHMGMFKNTSFTLTKTETLELIDLLNQYKEKLIDSSDNVEFVHDPIEDDCTDCGC